MEQTQNKTGLELDKTFANPDIKVKDYEELFIGFELEADEIDAEETADYLGVPYGHHNGKSYKKKRIRGQNGLKIEFNAETDRYKESDIVVEVYDDGSVPTEIVTRPVNLKKLPEIKKLHHKLTEFGADFWADGKAGTHLTFLLDPHKELSRFDKIVVQNLIQLTRRFFPQIIRTFRGNDNQTRKTSFRKIPSFQEMKHLNTDHYTAISCRYDNDGNIWAIEIRMPDGTNDFSLLEKQVKFWLAMIRQSAVISRYGRIAFSQEIWSKNKQFNDRNVDRVINVRGKPKPMELFKIIEPSLRYYNFNSNAETDKDYRTKSRIIEMILQGKTIREIKKELKMSYEKIKRQTTEEN